MCLDKNGESRKYERLLSGTCETDCGKILCRIRALVDIGATVKAGDLGGYIQGEGNLSHDGKAWVSDDARVYGCARVFDDAQVYGHAQVYGNARVHGQAVIQDNVQVSSDAQVYGGAKVYDSARVSDSARVYGCAKVWGNAQVSGNARVTGCAKVYGSAQVSGKAFLSDLAIVFGSADIGGDVKVTGVARIGGDAKATNKEDWVVFSNIGNGLCALTCAKTGSGTLHVISGHFSGTDEAFLNAVKEYELLIKVARSQILGEAIT